MTEQFLGRVYEFLDRFQTYRVIPWPYGKETPANYDEIIQLGTNFPVGYNELYGQRVIHFVASHKLINDFKKRAEFNRIKGLSIGGLIPPELIGDEEYESRYVSWEYTERGEALQDYICDLLVDWEKDLKVLDSLILGNYFMDDYLHVFYNFNKLDEIVDSFQNLKHLFVRGGFSKTGAEKKIKNPNIETLIVQSLGLHESWLKKILSYNLPNLQHLELYIGTEHFKGARDIELLTELFSGDLFPKLKYLGLQDNDITTEISYEIAHSPLIEKLEVLDLSKGSLTDDGAEILVNSPKIKKLKLLDLSSNHCTENFINYVKKISKKQKLNINIEKQRGPVGERYSVIRE